MDEETQEDGEEVKSKFREFSNNILQLWDKCGRLIFESISQIRSSDSDDSNTVDNRRQ